LVVVVAHILVFLKARSLRSLTVPPCFHHHVDAFVDPHALSRAQPDHDHAGRYAHAIVVVHQNRFSQSNRFVYEFQALFQESQDELRRAKRGALLMNRGKKRVIKTNERILN